MIITVNTKSDESLEIPVFSGNEHFLKPVYGFTGQTDSVLQSVVERTTAITLNVTLGYNTVIYYLRYLVYGL